MSEFPMIRFSSSIIGPCRNFRAIKVTEPDTFPIHSNASIPANVTAKRNALETAGIVLWRSHIPRVLMVGTFAKIIFPIIKCIAILVVTLLTGATAMQNLPMHEYRIRAYGIEGIPNFRDTPVPLREPLKIFGIDNRILSLCERNKSVGFVQRLDDCVAFHVVNSHWSSLKGLLLPAAIIT